MFLAVPGVGEGRGLLLNRRAADREQIGVSVERVTSTNRNRKHVQVLTFEKASHVLPCAWSRLESCSCCSLVVTEYIHISNSAAIRVVPCHGRAVPADTTLKQA